MSLMDDGEENFVATGREIFLEMGMSLQKFQG
jgi:hypothetical protein